MIEFDDAPEVSAEGYTRELSPYEEICREDFLHWIKPLLESGNWVLRVDDGKLYIRHPRIDYEYAWHYVNLDRLTLECWIFHTVVHNTINKRIPEPFIHSRCHSCYKVVVLPRTLRELFALEDIQLSTAERYHCKCGTDLRSYTDSAYSGYFYNNSLPSGLRCWMEIRTHVNNHPDMGEDVPVILKRGCTEFERDLGPSDKWRITPSQHRIEAMISELIVPAVSARVHPPHMVKHTHRKWIEHAQQIGDKTYKLYTNGEPPIPPPVTYHHLAEEYQARAAEMMEQVEQGLREAREAEDESGDVEEDSRAYRHETGNEKTIIRPTNPGPFGTVPRPPEEDPLG